MASPTTPTHGKWGNIYVYRPNGFKGDGLNDVTWGAYSAETDSSYFEVVIDGEAEPDTFKWRENGGDWTEDVEITGAAQSLVGTNGTASITFAATTGHTEDDQWTIGHLKTEACTESTNTAQITDADLRVLNPNAPPTWTDAGGEAVVETHFAAGQAVFTGSVGEVTVEGDNAFILRSGLTKVGYAQNWSLNVNLDMSDISAFQDQWKVALPGQASASGSIGTFFIGNKTLFENMEDNIDGTLKYFYVELFNYDPDNDQTGDHFRAWVTFTNLSVDASLTDIVKETVNFQVHGMPYFVANS